MIGFLNLSMVDVSKQTVEPPKLLVKGEALLFKPADQMQLSVGVVTQHDDPQQALRLNNAKMAQVIKSLNQLGLVHTDYQTGQFQIQPIHTVPPKEPPADWKAKVSHYEVTNTIRIKTQRLDLTSEIILASSQSGANQIENIQFDLKDPRSYRAEAIKKATENAIADANILAKAAGVKLTGVRSLTLDQGHPVFSAPRALMYKASAESLSENTPIEAGAIEVRASVDMIFDISAL